MEQLLTFLSTDLPWKTDVQKSADIALYYEITQQIQLRLSGLCKDLKSEEYSENIKKFFDFILDNPAENNFITLNYDLLLEELISQSVYKKYNKEFIDLSEMYAYPMAWIGSRKQQNYGLFNTETNINLPKIIKLHGSINWFWPAVTASDIIYYQSLYDIKERSVETNSSFLSGLKQYIIPPVMDKNSFYKHIMVKNLWKKARGLLINAEEIYIIGFSMPMSDLSVRFLFQSALENSNSKIFIVNTAKKTDLAPNYEGIFSGKLDYSLSGEKYALNEMIKKILP